MLNVTWKSLEAHFLYDHHSTIRSQHKHGPYLPACSVAQICRGWAQAMHDPWLWHLNPTISSCLSHGCTERQSWWLFSLLAFASSCQAHRVQCLPSTQLIEAASSTLLTSESKHRGDTAWHGFLHRPVHLKARTKKDCARMRTPFTRCLLCKCCHLAQPFCRSLLSCLYSE